MTRPRLCLTVTAPTTAELRARRDAARDADLVELRIDTVADPDVRAALAGRRQPVIVTCRPAWEGGSFRGSEEERHRLLKEALTLGAEYVDIEERAPFRDLLLKEQPQHIVLSKHDFEHVPADLSDTVRSMKASGAGVVKIAVKTARLSDTIPLLELGRRLDGPGAHVLVGMGEPGLVTRILPARFGSAWSYAGELSFVGQLTAATLADEYRFKSLGASPEMYGLVGSPISHSVSPAMHNAAFRAAARDAVYLPLPAADAEDFVTFARAFGLSGASVTIPFKVTLLNHVQSVDDIARDVGAINTIRNVDGRWEATNTDVTGFLQPLHSRGVRLAGLRTSILGAGGAARGVAVALARSKAVVRVHARNRDRAAAVAERISGGVGPWPPEPGSWDLLVNTTPVGMHPQIADSPVVPGELTGRLVYDLIYNPPTTRLLRDAAGAGLQALGGLDMLVAQAEAQFMYWTGETAPAGVMRAAAEKRLAEFTNDEAHVR
jgi:3-dehydroquinate dehydratase/shikimate dehydrogenase